MAQLSIAMLTEQALGQLDKLTFNLANAECRASANGNVTLTATDVNNNSASATAAIKVVDAIAPTITLNGNATETVEAYTSYTDAGATATDNCSAPEVTVGGAVDINTPGVYKLTYDASDASGNAATQVSRTVTVVDNTPPTVVTKDITVYLDANGNASVTPQQVDNGSSDASGTVTLSLDKTTFDVEAYKNDSLYTIPKAKKALISKGYLNEKFKG